MAVCGCFGWQGADVLGSGCGCAGCYGVGMLGGRVWVF